MTFEEKKTRQAKIINVDDRVSKTRMSQCTPKMNDKDNNGSFSKAVKANGNKGKRN